VTRFAGFVAFGSSSETLLLSRFVERVVRHTGSHPDPNASLERAGIYIRSKPWISSHGSVNPVGVLDTLESTANTQSYFLLTLASFLR